MTWHGSVFSFFHPDYTVGLRIERSRTLKIFFTKTDEISVLVIAFATKKILRARGLYHRLGFTPDPEGY